jgi:hypothetical protein
MAITAFAPAITRSKELIVEKTNQVALKIVNNDSESKQANRKFFAVFISIVGVSGFMLLLVINTLLAQDAFELSRLKAESRLVSDQREALSRAIEKSSSPSALAHSALALGMRPSDSPIFLNLDIQTPESGVKLNG